MIRLIQLAHAGRGRRVAVVEEDRCVLLNRYPSIYELAQAAVTSGRRLVELAAENRSSERVDYEALYRGQSLWCLLPSFDHPEEPARCLVSGTGLTHKASADNRQSMHQDAAADRQAPLTDSMKMYQWGMEGGRPAPGRIGVSPEWFYKGCGTILRAHHQPLEVPRHAEDGGEEPEIAGAYLIGSDGCAYRVGLSISNEFSDHVFEKKNYLYLAPSKLRQCALGPELIVEGDFNDVRGRVSIEREGRTTWSAAIATGEKNMCHSLANLEHHHFKHDQHRRPGDAHVHFLGADAFSFGAGLRLEDGDVMVIEWQGFGRPLRNPIRFLREPDQVVRVKPL